MVGVAGRSKGCITCRKRRVKCDEAQPLCNRCKRGGFACAGYAREPVFIRQNPGNVKTTAKTTSRSLEQRSDDSRRTTPTGTGTSIIPIRQASNGSSNSDVSSQSSAETKNSSNGDGLSMPHVTAPTVLLPNGYRDDLLFRFLSRRMFGGTPNSSHFTVFEDQSNRRDHKGTLVYLSSQALATVYFGMLQGEKSLYELGLSLYSTGLRRLKENLQDKTKVRQTDTFQGISILNLFELITFTSDDGWIHHALGMEHLIGLRGPQAHQSPIDLQVFDAIRLNVIIASLAVRKRTFLSSPEWKRIPWEHAPQSKSPMAHLDDILLDIPGMLADLEAFKDPQISPKASISLAEDLNPRVAACLRQLGQWRQDWEKRNPEVCAEFGTDFLSGLSVDEDGEPIFPTVLMFNSFALAYEIAIYNCGVILTTLVGARTTAVSASMDPAVRSPRPEVSANRTNPLSLPGKTLDLQDAYQAAMEICRLVEYILLPQHRGSGSLLIIFPIRMALQVPGIEGTRVADWLRRVVRTIMSPKDGMGWKVGEHVLRAPRVQEL